MPGGCAICPPTGVTATDDRDALINADADVVLYMGKVETDTAGCFADVCDLLTSGKNVVATGSRFIHPRSLDASLADGIESRLPRREFIVSRAGTVPGLRRGVAGPGAVPA